MKVTRKGRKSRKKWEVDYGIVNGKRRRKYFATKSQAEQYLRIKSSERHNLGTQALNLTRRDVDELLAIREKLQGVGTPTEAADFFLRHRKHTKPIPIGELIDRCEVEKKQSAKRGRYLQTIKSHWKIFRVGREETLSCDVSTDDIREFINSGKTKSGEPWTVATRRSYLLDIRTLFEWARKQRHCAENPALAVEMPHLEETPPRALSIADIKTLLKAGVEIDPEVTGGYIAPILFGGPRRSEMRRVSGAEASADAIDIKSHKAKTRQRRVIEPSEQLKAWLALCPKWPITNLTKRFYRIRAHAKIEWPRNCLRHSFCSYAIWIYGAQKTAAAAGHSEQKLFSTYRALVSRKDAEEWAGLLPTSQF